MVSRIDTPDRNTLQKKLKKYYNHQNNLPTDVVILMKTPA